MVDLNFTGLFGRLRVILWPLIAISLYGPCQPFFLYQTSISNYSGVFRMLVVFGPFRVLRAPTICFSVQYFQRPYIVLVTASACFSINGIGGKSRFTYRKALKTSKVGTSLSGPAILFTAFSAIQRIVSSEKTPPSSA